MEKSFDLELLKLINFFEDFTGAAVKDAFYDDNEKLTFVVEPGNIGKAVGKNAKTLKKVEEKLGERIRVAEYSDDLLEFVESLVAPLTLVDKREEDGIVYLEGKDEKTTGLLIGKHARNLRNLESMVRRYMPVEEIKVETNPSGAREDAAQEQ